MPRNNARFPGGPGSPRSRQSTPRCSAAPIERPVGASRSLGPSGLYVHSIRTRRVCQEGLSMRVSAEDSSLATSAAPTGSAEPETTEAAPDDSDSAAPPRRGVVGWILYDFGDTIFQQNMITNYFPIWVVAVMGGA